MPVKSNILSQHKAETSNDLKPSDITNKGGEL